MQGKSIVDVAAAKRHTLVLTAEGDIFTWGHRVVTPRRVPLAGTPFEI
jgi:alpha-tubulin suppressor-like RCC1 family protein